MQPATRAGSVRATQVCRACPVLVTHVSWNRASQARATYVHRKIDVRRSHGNDYIIASGQSYILSLLEGEEKVTAVLLSKKSLKQTRLCQYFWIKPWLHRRPMLGQYETLFPELIWVEKEEICPGKAVQMILKLCVLLIVRTCFGRLCVLRW